ncbi:MAG: tyrosine--tRNA ligase 2 [Candidatus Parcubacteria bacterium]|nr:MAG: tyrosine--tRNA ligase 2 [Candidatus Parcubacteria bacterium]
MKLEKEIIKQFDIIKRKTKKIITEEELKQKLIFSLKKRKPLKIKLGIDPTVKDIHLGFALVLKKLKDFQMLGHRVILVIGDFTAKIGDPSGRNITRPEISDQEIKNNMKSYLNQIFKILDKKGLEIKYNSTWLKKLNLKNIINIFSKITLQKITERDDFQERLKQNNPVFLHEIVYPLLQAYDSFYLRADIELGGVDQELNCLMGRELQTKFNHQPQVIILMPLLIGLDGKNKMSKSLKNYIGINETPDEIFGKVMSIPDSLLSQWLELATDLDKNEIERILQGHPLEAKKRLGYEIVKLYHNEKKAKIALQNFEKTFQKKDYSVLAKDIIVPKEILNLPLIEILSKLNLVTSKSQAKRLLQQGGIEINYQKILNKNNINNLIKDLNNGDILRIGKKNFYRIIIKE